MTPAEQAREALEKGDKSLVQDLREFWPDGFNVSDVSDICERAAKEIERLQAALAPAADEVRLKVRWVNYGNTMDCMAGNVPIGGVVQASNSQWYAVCHAIRWKSELFDTRVAACDALVQKIRGG